LQVWFYTPFTGDVKVLKEQIDYDLLADTIMRRYYSRLVNEIVQRISYVKLAEEIIRATDFLTQKEREQNA
jgi:hypothetical protein